MLKVHSADVDSRKVPSILTRSRTARASTITEVGKTVIESACKKRKIDTEAVALLVRSHSAPLASKSSSFAVSVQKPQSQQIEDDVLAESTQAKVPAWRKRMPTEAELRQEMVLNSKRAIKEHKATEGSVCASVLSMTKKRSNDKYSVTCQIAERRGRRPAMEDAFLFKEVDRGYLAAIFDGHGGFLVSKYASQVFANTFSKAIEKSSGNIPRALESTIENIHKQVAVKKSMRYMGSTVLASFIERDGTVYTATVGDSEAYFYGKNRKGELKSQPLSIVRNWSDPEEANRARQLARTDEEAKVRETWSGSSNPKRLRVRSAAGLTLNLSRSVGDPTYLEVGIKPEITVAKLREGKIGLLCDGVTDFVSQAEVVDLLKAATPGEDLAAKVADYALTNKRSTDNITAMFLDVKRSTNTI